MTNPLERRVVGTAGHIDHGKTALVRALTGIDCDRLPEEKKRGITIDLGFASLRSDDLQIGFVDVPGHEKFVKNMLAGIGGIDAVVLVVAADESIMPQTREHFEICKLLGVSEGLVAITKADLVDEETIDVVRLEVEEMATGSFLEGKPLYAVSATTGIGIDEFHRGLVELVRHAPARDAGTFVFRLPIDRVFTMKGFGSVVTGTTVSGSIAADSEVEILPGGIRSRARNVQVHGEAREVAMAGERTSINLSDVSLEKLDRGQQLVEPGRLRESQILTVRIETLADAPPLRDQARIRFHHYSSEILGAIRLLGTSERKLIPGESSWAQIRLESPVVAISGDRFVIRRYSPMTTIGGGIIIDPHLPRLKRATRPEIFEALASADLGTRLTELARLAGIHGVSERDLLARTGLTGSALHERLSASVLEDLSVVSGAAPTWIHREHIESTRKKAMSFLENFFTTNRMSVGAPKSEFLQKILPPNVDARLVVHVLADLTAQKIAVIEGDMVDVPGRSKELSGQEGELGRLLEDRFREAGLTPPSLGDLIKSIPRKPRVMEGVVAFLIKTGTLVRLAEGINIHKDVLASAKQQVRAHAGELVDVAWFKEMFGITRKVVIPLLEHFDATDVTRRIGDKREIL